MLTFKKSKSGEQVTIVLKDEVGIDQAVKMQEHLVKGFKESAELIINLEKISDIHLTIIQLIISAFNEAEQINKKVSLNGYLSENIKTILENTGIIYKDGVVLENEKNSFWVTGGI